MLKDQKKYTVNFLLSSKIDFLIKNVVAALSVILTMTQCSGHREKTTEWSENIKIVLDNTTHLKYDRGNRLPLYLWPAIDPGVLNPDAAEQLVAELNKRGVGLVCSWNSKDSSNLIPRCLTVARAQKKLGQRVNIQATDLMNSFFNGDELTAHIDENGKPFFDNSFGPHKMGCPFAIDFRKKEIRERFEYFVKKYKDQGLPVDFIFTDWEIDGPLEVNRAFEASKRCARCCKYLGKNFTFEEFQKTLREMRSYLQNYAYSTPVLRQFPHALVGNYAIYPNDGYRYWYDYFEYWVEGQPFKPDQRAKYRKWYNDFPATGYTYAMPVCYNWDPSYNWYDFNNKDYRWFYNMLLVASNAGKSTPQNIPIISFVHWNTVFITGKADTAVKQMSKESYQELLWHMLLRGTDTFFLWAEKEEFPEEVRLVHEVYAAAQQYGEFLEHGVPITYDVPDSPGTVISGLAMGDSVLVRRTDFGTNHDPVEILAGTKHITVGYSPGLCRIIALD
jgi:hypothetical protein